MKVIDVDAVMRDTSAGSRLSHDANYEQGAAFANGEYCPIAQATVSLLDAGFLSCDAVYEKLTVSKGRYYRIEDHYARLKVSCEKFRLRNPYTENEMTRIFDKLLSLTGLQQAGLFFCVTRGLASQDGARADSGASDSRFYALANPYMSIATREQRGRGLSILISRNHIRIPPKAVDPTVKSFHWMDMKLSLFEAKERGHDWSVLTDIDGFLTEAPGANLFFVKNKVLYTPGSGCLLGITRKSVLEIAAELGMSTHVDTLHCEQLKQSDEAFLTSSAGGVMPVRCVDGMPLGHENPPSGITAHLHNLYWERMWEGWHGTPVGYACDQQ